MKSMKTKFVLVKRQWFFKGKSKPVTVQGAHPPRGSMQYVDKAVFRYATIEEARQALQFLQDMATDCSYYIIYPQSEVSKRNTMEYIP